MASGLEAVLGQGGWAYEPTTTLGGRLLCFIEDMGDGDAETMRSLEQSCRLGFMAVTENALDDDVRLNKLYRLCVVRSGSVRPGGCLLTSMERWYRIAITESGWLFRVGEGR